MSYPSTGHITDITVGIDPETGDIRLVLLPPRGQRPAEPKPVKGFVDSIFRRCALRALRIPEVQAELIRIVRDPSVEPPPVKFKVDMRGAADEAIARVERMLAQVNGSIERRSLSVMAQARKRGAD